MNCCDTEHGEKVGKWSAKNVRINKHGSCGWGIWLIGWLFTIGFLHLAFWKGILALIIWPYYIGVFVSAMMPLAR